MASFTSFFYDLFFGSNWSKSYCEDPTTKANIAQAVLPLTTAVPQPNIAAAVLPLATNATVETPVKEITAPELLPLITSNTFKRRRLGVHN
jgi:hypothetical protein